jgi:ribosome-associated protein
MTESHPDPPAVEGLDVAPGVRIPVSELSWRFTTSSGPGGQHVNTSHTRVEVRFDVQGSPTLPAWARDRILSRLGPTVAAIAGDERSQARNRTEAVARLTRRLVGALAVERPRKPTRPTLASRRRRLDAKRRQGARKRERGFRAGPEDG